GLGCAREAIKQKATTLFGETDHDRFLTTVQNAFHEGGQAITDSLRDPSVTDEQRPLRPPAASLVRTIDAGIGTPERRFAGYVPESVEAMAIAEPQRLFGRVETIDSGTISGHIPAP